MKLRDYFNGGGAERPHIAERWDTAAAMCPAEVCRSLGVFEALLEIPASLRHCKSRPPTEAGLSGHMGTLLQ